QLERVFRRLPFFVFAGELHCGVPDHRGVNVLLQRQHLSEVFDSPRVPQAMDDGEFRERLVLRRLVWCRNVELAGLVHPVPLGHGQIHLYPPQGGRHRERLIRDLRHTALFIDQSVSHWSASPPRYSMTTTTPAEPLRPSFLVPVRYPPPTP